MLANTHKAQKLTKWQERLSLSLCSLYSIKSIQTRVVKSFPQNNYNCRDGALCLTKPWLPTWQFFAPPTTICQHIFQLFIFQLSVQMDCFSAACCALHPILLFFPLILYIQHAVQVSINSCKVQTVKVTFTGKPHSNARLGVQHYTMTVQTDHFPIQTVNMLNVDLLGFPHVHMLSICTSMQLYLLPDVGIMKMYPKYQKGSKVSWREKMLTKVVAWNGNPPCFHVDNHGFARHGVPSLHL